METEADWEVFEGVQQPFRSVDEPRVTLGPRGTFYMNGMAFEAIGSPVAVELMYDRGRRVIGMRAVDPRMRNAFKIVRHGKVGTYKRICASSFCNHMRIKRTDTVVFNQVAVDDNGVMTLDLGATSVVKRGSR